MRISSLYRLLIYRNCVNFHTFKLRWTGIRDDLMFLFDEQLSSISLCALHGEMRNTEQLLGSLGLFAYKCNTLTECNKVLGDYGPEISRGYNRITVKLRQGQQTAVEKSNISVASFSGELVPYFHCYFMKVYMLWL